jgi:hypothetical protein
MKWIVNEQDRYEVYLEGINGQFYMEIVGMAQCLYRMIRWDVILPVDVYVSGLTEYFMEQETYIGEFPVDDKFKQIALLHVDEYDFSEGMGYYIVSNVVMNMIYRIYFSREVEQ